jgi:triphosphoribosyl-dephospho-CoA synthase
MPSPFTATSPGTAATLACIYEVTAPKPGNVHPAASFEDQTHYAQFVHSAVVIGPILDVAAARGVGRTVLDAVRATRQAVGTNTNLGTLLLFAPLAAVPATQSLDQGIGDVLRGLSGVDTRHVYEAIRLSSAGGLGRSAEADVLADVPPKLGLVDVMRLAAERDLVARQYTNAFADVFHGPAAWIAEGLSRGLPLGAAIVNAHIWQVARHPDSLIARKCGLTVAIESSQRAAEALSAGSPGESRYEKALSDLDQWLRADGHRRNPGTSADFIAAGLFVLLREGRLHWSQW